MELQYIRVYESISGGWVDLHPLHGEDELEDNLQACKLLAQKGYRLQLLPCLDREETVLRQMLLPDVFGNKNPDVRISNKVADIKTPQKKEVTKTALKDAIYRAAQQKVEMVIINLYQATYSFSHIKEALLSTLQTDRNRSIREAWIITHDNNLLIIPRKMINTKKFYTVLNCL
ncbi:hypothetical protein D3H65_27145 [Paraflavitalea soli]|uniref:tRNA nuclease CdiA C-terminal domain-containing protein n=1 Tax=Paraflavitalea soli TaxID=2315862 RepID=A0A3B7MVK7_9BACT|nr:hypothetical protein [Paraflavitalea soli]AXY77433.1 hypothetical protein D3H65_27145 [Paraflavitalea soli]